MAIVNITCWSDADFYRQFVYQTVDGTPVNMTGTTMRMGVRRRASDAHEEFLLTTENGALALVDAAAGKFTVLIRRSQLLQMTVGEYEHSLICISGQLWHRIWSGALVLNPGASR